MFFVVVAWDKPGMSDLRRRTKPLHKQHLDTAAPDLRVLQSGPLLSEQGSEHGSLLVVEADQASTVRAFVDHDPYVAVGLFASIEVSRWLWRRGNPHFRPAPQGVQDRST